MVLRQVRGSGCQRPPKESLVHRLRNLHSKAPDSRCWPAVRNAFLIQSLPELYASGLRHPAVGMGQRTMGPWLRPKSDAINQ